MCVICASAYKRALIYACIIGKNRSKKTAYNTKLYGVFEKEGGIFAIFLYIFLGFPVCCYISITRNFIQPYTLLKRKKRHLFKQVSTSKYIAKATIFHGVCIKINEINI